MGAAYFFVNEKIGALGGETQCAWLIGCVICAARPGGIARPLAGWSVTAAGAFCGPFTG